MIFHSNPRTVACVEEGDDRATRERDEDSGVQLREEREGRKDRGVENVRQLVGRPRGFQCSRRHIAGQQQRDRIHHEADDELVDAEIDPQGSPERSPIKLRRQTPPRRRAGCEEWSARDGIADNSGGQRAHQHLAFGADVPEAGAKRHGDSKAGEDQRRRQLQRDRQIGPSDEPALDQDRIDLEGVLADRRDQNAAGDDRDPDRGDRSEQRTGEAAAERERSPMRWRCFNGHVEPAPLRPSHARRWAPHAGRPSGGRLPRRSVSSATRSATMRPRYITRMRSESEKISSRSAEMTKTARPLSRISTRIRWIASIAPMSTPRDGCSAMTSRVAARQLARKLKLLLVAAGERSGRVSRRLRRARRTCGSARSRSPLRRIRHQDRPARERRQMAERKVLPDLAREGEADALAVRRNIGEPGVAALPGLQMSQPSFRRSTRTLQPDGASRRCIR